MVYQTSLKQKEKQAIYKVFCPSCEKSQVVPKDKISEDKEGGLSCSHCSEYFYYTDAPEDLKPMTLLKTLFSVEGRVPRSTFWICVLAIDIIGLITAFVYIKYYPSEPRTLFYLWCVISFYPGVVLTVKRLSDRDRTGWFMLVLLVPILNFWFLIELYFLRGTIGFNRFGADPLGLDKISLLENQ